mgnify:FL=1
MDLHKACNILNIEFNDILDKKKLKKAYHREALRHHPDKIHSQTDHKNGDPGQRFREIREAYEFLNMYTGEKPTDEYSSDYREYIKVYISSLFPKNVVDESILNTIIDKIINKLETKSAELIHKWSGEYFIDLISILKKNIYILNPSLDDLLNQNVYKLQHNEKEYIIPLWQSELEYDNSGSTLIVKCVPDLPDHIEIDEDNNIHISLRFSLFDKIQQHNNKIEISLGSKNFEVSLEDLQIKKYQIKKFVNSGIPKFDENDIYSVDNISDVNVHFEISDF